MTNPRTLLLSIAATACCFILTLVGLARPAPIAPAPAVAAATVPGVISAVTLDTDRFDRATLVIAPELAESGPSRPPDAADRDNGPNPLHGRAQRPSPHGSPR